MPNKLIVGNPVALQLLEKLESISVTSETCTIKSETLLRLIWEIKQSRSRPATDDAATLNLIADEMRRLSERTATLTAIVETFSARGQA